MKQETGWSEKDVQSLQINSDTHQLEYLSRAITRTFCSQVEKAIIYSSREKAEYLLFLEPEAYVKECMIRQPLPITGALHPL